MNYQNLSIVVSRCKCITSLIITCICSEAITQLNWKIDAKQNDTFLVILVTDMHF